MVSSLRDMLAFLGVLYYAATVFAEHSVVMENFCGTGTPILDHLPSITLNTGTSTYTNDTVDAVAFLNTGNCGPNGGQCTTVDIELGTQNGGTSSVVIDLLPTHEFTVSAGFSYFNGCDGAGTSCLQADCTTAQTTTVGQGVVTCSAPNVGVLVTFCPDLKPPPTQQNSSTTLPSSTSSTTSGDSTSTPVSTTSSPASSVSQASSSSPPTAAIAGGVVGGCVLLVILAALCFLCWRRRRDTHLDPLPPNPFPALVTPYVATFQDRYNSDGASSSVRDMSVRSSSAALVSTPVHSSKSSPSFGPGHGGTSSIDSGQSSPVANSDPPAQPNLDQIIEGLANRFGWTAPNHDVDALPAYHSPSSFAPN